MHFLYTQHIGTLNIWERPTQKTVFFSLSSSLNNNSVSCTSMFMYRQLSCLLKLTESNSSFFTVRCCFSIFTSSYFAQYCPFFIVNSTKEACINRLGSICIFIISEHQPDCFLEMEVNYSRQIFLHFPRSSALSCLSLFLQLSQLTAFQVTPAGEHTETTK